MFKRSLIILLTLAMLCSVGCSNKTTVDNPDETGEITSPTPAETEPRFKIPEDAVMNDTQKEAAEAAQEHLNGAGVSRATLIKTLVDEGHSEEDAIFAVDLFGIDWMEMARGTAEFYTYYMPFSYQGIIDHLKYMEFTPEEAQYGADQVEVDWDSMANKYIEKYYLYGSFTNDEIITELTEAGFTEEQAKNGLKEYEDKLAEDSSLREELGLD
ncbi:MAG: Ltp family lipoprotein [Clostridia bacterium]|nr:Ltp family lipoprotein [Clostridia bacterium]